MIQEKRIKQLTKRINFKAGRNFGLITSPRKKSFTRRIYRFLDTKRNSYPKVPAILRSIEYDGFRNSLIGLICYPFGLLQYISVCQNSKPGDEIVNFGNNIGDSMCLKTLRSGSIISNIGIFSKSCGSLIKSAGSNAIMIRNSNGFSLVKLKSGELRLFDQNVMCVLGSVSNSEYFLRDLKKAGTSMKLSKKRPRNRPLARNPVDHPMGGRTKGGVSLNPKGQYSKWTPTVYKMSKYRVLIRRKTKYLTI